MAASCALRGPAVSAARVPPTAQGPAPTLRAGGRAGGGRRPPGPRGGGRPVSGREGARCEKAFRAGAPAALEPIVEDAEPGPRRGTAHRGEGGLDAERAGDGARRPRRAAVAG